MHIEGRADGMLHAVLELDDGGCRGSDALRPHDVVRYRVLHHQLLELHRHALGRLMQAAATEGRSERHRRTHARTIRLPQTRGGHDNEMVVVPWTRHPLQRPRLRPSPRRSHSHRRPPCRRSRAAAVTQQPHSTLRRDERGEVEQARGQRVGAQEIETACAGDRDKQQQHAHTHIHTRTHTHTPPASGHPPQAASTTARWAAP